MLIDFVEIATLHIQKKICTGRVHFKCLDQINFLLRGKFGENQFRPNCMNANVQANVCLMLRIHYSRNKLMPYKNRDFHNSIFEIHIRKKRTEHKNLDKDQILNCTPT